MGKAIFFGKGSLSIEILVKALEAIEVWVNRRFSNTCCFPNLFGLEKRIHQVLLDAFIQVLVYT